MVTGTKGWSFLQNVLFCVTVVVCAMHFTLPLPVEKDGKGSGDSGKAAVEGTVSVLKELVALKEKGALTEAEFKQQKAALMPSQRAAPTSPQKKAATAEEDDVLPDNSC